MSQQAQDHGPEYRHVDDMEWETLRFPGQHSKMVFHPRPERPSEPNTGFVRYLPGSFHPRHRHDFAQVWYILEGTFKIGERTVTGRAVGFRADPRLRGGSLHRNRWSHVLRAIYRAVDRQRPDLRWALQHAGAQGAAPETRASPRPWPRRPSCRRPAAPRRRRRASPAWCCRIFDAGGAIDAGVDRELGHLGERQLGAWAKFQNSILRCRVALPAVLSSVSVVEPDCSTMRCGAFSMILAMASPGARSAKVGTGFASERALVLEVSRAFRAGLTGTHSA